MGAGIEGLNGHALRHPDENPEGWKGIVIAVCVFAALIIITIVKIIVWATN